MDNTHMHFEGQVACLDKNLRLIEKPWRRLVRGLWWAGFETCSSCAGHLKSEEPAHLDWLQPFSKVGERGLFELFQLALQRLGRYDLDGDWRFSVVYCADTIVWRFLAHPSEIDEDIEDRPHQDQKGHWTRGQLKIIETDIKKFTIAVEGELNRLEWVRRCEL